MSVMNKAFVEFYTSGGALVSGYIPYDSIEAFQEAVNAGVRSVTVQDPDSGKVSLVGLGGTWNAKPR